MSANLIAVFSTSPSGFVARACVTQGAADSTALAEKIEQHFVCSAEVSSTVGKAVVAAASAFLVVVLNPSEGWAVPPFPYLHKQRCALHTISR